MGLLLHSLARCFPSSLCALLQSSSHLFIWFKKMLHSHTTFTWYRSMVTVEERVSLLAQQVTNMMADVTTLRSELAGSGAQFAELLVRLVTNDPRIKRIVDASEETATIVSRVQALEARSPDTATISPMRFRSKEGE